MTKSWKDILDVWQGPDNIFGIYCFSTFNDKFEQVFPKNEPISIQMAFFVLCK